MTTTIRMRVNTITAIIMATNTTPHQIIMSMNTTSTIGTTSMNAPAVKPRFKSLRSKLRIIRNGGVP